MRILLLVAISATMFLYVPAKAADGSVGLLESLLAPAGLDADLDAGLELRVREEIFDDIPISADPPGVSRGGRNNSMRFRSRVWTSLEAGDILLYGRVANEFRYWAKPRGGGRPYNWPDEALVDNLYLRLTDFFGDGSVLTVGRQDIALGSRRMVLEGTPKDGSRTIYMDGVSFGVPLDEVTRVDVFAVYNSAENRLVAGHEHRDLVGYYPYNTSMAEAGVGVFISSRYTESLPFELSYIYKHDTSYKIPAGTAEGEFVRVRDSDYHTVGLRLLPDFSSTFSAELELAGQFGKEGDENVRAMMIAGGVAWSPEHELKPSLSANIVYLSGDDPATGRQEGWNPLWGRYPWISELLVYSWDADKAGFWTNMIYPYIQAACSPSKGQKLRASVGPILAEEKDGPGGGGTRGWLGIARWDFPLAQGLIGARDNLSGHLVGEIFDPGSYYAVDSTSYFVRWEILYRY